MYIPFGEKAPLGLTENEVLFDRVSSKRLIQIIQNPKHKVLESSRDSNSYGEFRFITIADSKKVVTFFGNGFHEYRDRYFAKEWHIGDDDSLSVWKKRHPRARPLDKTKVLQNLRLEIIEYESRNRRHQQSSRGRSFDTFSDLSDDDSMISSGYFD